MPGMAPPQQPAQAAASDQDSMRFEWVTEGPASACGGRCREWVSASGPITADTMRDFEFFRQARDLRGATIVLDSGGGSVLASLDLGRKLRELGMKAAVGRTIKLDDAPGEKVRAKLSPRGECASMCVFVLLGGVQRSVPAEARILVHQIWPGAKRYDASAESYTAEELVRIQRDVGRIARYTVEMGGDIELFELAMRIPPWERLRSLSQTELRRLRLQTLDGAAGHPPTSGALRAERQAKALSLSAPERGWTLAAGQPSQALARRHPLTLEGEEIGEFELSLRCGGGSERAFHVAYVDHRTLTDDHAARLKDVTLWLGGERVALTVEASTVETTDGELKSRAYGAVTAAFVERLKSDAGSVIVVGTRLTDNTRTSIRVGGTGFAKAFPAFANDCGM
jgi:hypothetical protein